MKYYQGIWGSLHIYKNLRKIINKEIIKQFVLRFE